MATTRPPMIDLDRWTDVAPVLDAALDLDGADRDAFVDAIADAEVRAEVRRFLAHGDTPATETLSGLFASARPAPLPPGTRLGAYRIEAPIGAGGGGAVYRALDVAADKAVAVKTLAASDRDAARVDREIRALSRLDHAGVVRYLASGTAGPDDGGGPPAPTRYLAMELVDGADIVTAADRDGLAQAERVRLLAETAHAVQAALDRAVLHRDLKPSNVLTARGEDGRLHPKILDYGIGVLLDEDADDPALRFTPGFAAPEQVHGDPATAATDVYGLGALGATLLTGEPPRDGLAALDALPRDLCAVLRRALAHDPADRYENAGLFEADLRRFLDRRPIRAGSKSAAHAAALFLSRNAPYVGLAALALCLAGVGVWRLAEARGEAETQAQAADEAATFLVGMLDAADPFAETTGDVDTMRIGEVVRLAALRLDRSPPTSAAVRARIECALGQVLTSLGHLDDADARFARCARDTPADTTAWFAAALRARSTLRSQQGREPEAEADAREATAVHRRLGRPTDEALDLLRLGEALTRQTKLDSAETPLRAGYALARRLDGGRGLLSATAANTLGNMLSQKGDFGESIRLCRESVRIRTNVLGQDHPQTAAALNDLGASLSNADSLAEAEQVLTRTVALYERLWGPDHLETAQPLQNLAVVYGRGGDFARSLPINRRTLAIRLARLGPDHPETLLDMNNLAYASRETGHIGEAIRLFGDALRRSRVVLGDSNETTIFNMGNLASTYDMQNQTAQSLPLHAESYGLITAIYGTDHPYTGMGGAAYARALVRAGRAAEALPIARAAARTLAVSFGADHPQRIFGDAVLGLALLRTSHRADALQMLRQADAAARRHLGPESATAAEIRAALAEAR